jgi:hypothetical protein
MTRPVLLAAAVLLFGAQVAPLSARTVVKVVPASVATGFPFSSSYRLSLLDLAAGADVGAGLALAGGIGAIDYYGWALSGPTLLPLAVNGYLLMSPEEEGLSTGFVPYATIGCYPLAISKYRAVVTTAGLGATWSFYAVTAGAEFRTFFWYERFYGNQTTYLLQLTFGLGGWYALGQGGDDGRWQPR